MTRVLKALKLPTVEVTRTGLKRLPSVVSFSRLRGSWARIFEKTSL